MSRGKAEGDAEKKSEEYFSLSGKKKRENEIHKYILRVNDDCYLSVRATFKTF